MGYVDDPGYPEFDAAAAKQLVNEYVASGGKAEFMLTSTSDPNALARVEILQQMLAEIGIKSQVRTIDQATVITEVLAGNFEATMWRQHAGGDADYQYIWWYGATANPTNFSRINDAEINEALAAGRVEPDPEKRDEIYQRIPPRFSAEAYSIWLAYAEWGIGLSNDVHGIFSAELPDGGGPVFTGLAAGHPVHGMWVTNG
jgi:peptide/nickel transport system substrate-binding protein